MIKYLPFFFLLILFSSCSNEYKEEQEICNCMNLYSIEHTEVQLIETEKCLKKNNISIDYNSVNNKEYIKSMNEIGKKLCPFGSRKFWHFLKIMDEKKRLFTGNKNQPQKMTFILVENSQCLLKKTYKSTDKQDLLGLWEDSLLWKKHSKDSCWLGMKSIERKIILKFNSTNTYIWEEKFENSKYNYIETGEYYINNRLDSTSLSLILNNSQDTLYNSNDTMVGRRFDLYWPDSNNILLVSKIIPGTNETPDVFEFKIKK